MMQASATKLAIKHRPPTFMIEHNDPQRTSKCQNLKKQRRIKNTLKLES